MYQLKTTYKKLLADTFTPVSIYLKLRDRFPNSILLESSDYHGNENSFSYICFQPLAAFVLDKGSVTETYPDQKEKTYISSDISSSLSGFSNLFKQEELPFKFIYNGLFGYTSYNAVRHFENIKFTGSKEENPIPEICYSLYRFIIAVNHFKNELYIIENRYKEDSSGLSADTIERLIYNKNIPIYKFKASEKETSDFSDEEFLRVVKKGKEHCQLGDVFQVVLSRGFQRPFTGDEFNVYRALRSVNPSPYLFYFDYGNFKIFGSSPEAQLVVKNNTATIFPIAGTFRRTGDDAADMQLAEKLKADPKENAEHTMLVDLARNDLSRNCSNVQVEVFREIQYYSHVIHLVSKVTGTLQNNVLPAKIMGDTFPAGTLSGAPKYRAMQLIDQYEPDNRGYYGGCIGYLGFDGNFNHAIIIRSFMSKNNVLHYRAGAGVVVSSNEESELQEVNNKLLALRTAVKLAEEI